MRGRVVGVRFPDPSVHIPLEVCTGLAAAADLSFSRALEALERGERVCRKGWNGKGMWLALTPGATIEPRLARAGAADALVKADDPSWVVINGHIDMRAADGSLTIGWAPSQIDMLAKDWMILESR